MIAIILSIIALVISIISLVMLVGQHKLIHRDVMNTIGPALQQWSSAFNEAMNTNLNEQIPRFVAGAVNGAVASLDIPALVRSEVAQHQADALLVEGQDESAK